MFILTKNEKGGAQWWHVFYDKGFVYLEHHHHPPYLEIDIDKHLYTFDYNQIRIAPIIGGEKDNINWSDLRGTEKDPDPFVIRGRTLGPVYLRIRKYVQSDLTGWFEKAGGGKDWNFTEGQKSKLANLYIPQIAEIVKDPGFTKQVSIHSTLKVIESLRKQIAEKRAFIDEVEKIINSEKYQLEQLPKPLIIP